MDRQREVRIRELRRRMSIAFAAGDALSVATVARELFAECDARSPAQVARLKRAAHARLRACGLGGAER